MFRKITGLLMIPLLIFVVSCASSPAAEEAGVEQIEAAKKSAIDARDKADSVKAAVSAKEDYDKGTAALGQADSLWSENKGPEALAAYRKSAASYDSAYKSAVEKREAAKKAIERAGQAIESAEQTARDGDDQTVDGGAQ